MKPLRVMPQALCRFQRSVTHGRDRQDPPGGRGGGELVGTGARDYSHDRCFPLDLAGLAVVAASALPSLPVWRQNRVRLMMVAVTGRSTCGSSGIAKRQT